MRGAGALHRANQSFVDKMGRAMGAAVLSGRNAHWTSHRPCWARFATTARMGTQSTARERRFGNAQDRKPRRWAMIEWYVDGVTQCQDVKYMGRRSKRIQRSKKDLRKIIGWWWIFIHPQNHLNFCCLKNIIKCILGNGRSSDLPD